VSSNFHTKLSEKYEMGTRKQDDSTVTSQADILFPCVVVVNVNVCCSVCDVFSCSMLLHSEGTQKTPCYKPEHHNKISQCVPLGFN